jgi:hypothetical protein
MTIQQARGPQLPLDSDRRRPDHGFLPPGTLEEVTGQKRNRVFFFAKYYNLFLDPVPGKRGNERKGPFLSLGRALIKFLFFP